MSSLKAKIAAVATFAAATGTALLLATSASAATTPAAAITGDPNAGNGTLTFYDGSGNVVTSGNAASLAHMFTYAAASTAGRAGTNKATMYYSFPDHNQVDSQNWVTQQQSTSTTFPVTASAAPANIKAISNPVVTAASTYANMNDASAGVTQDTTAGYQGIVQIRLYDTSASVSQDTKFWATDVYYDASGWQQVYPKVVTATTTTLSVNPDPSTVGDAVTLTANESPAAAGSVQFKDNGTNIGSAVAVDGTGKATLTTSTLAQGSHPLSAVFTPTDATSYGSSTGNFTATVNPPATATTTTLSVTGGYQTTGSASTLTGSVSPAAAPGSVSFYDNGSATAIPGTVTSPSAGTYVLDLPAGFAKGSHSVVAKFTPTNVANYRVSQSAAQAFLTQDAAVGACAQPGSVCTDQQNIQATIPTGTLVISTPYTAASPLDLGTLTLSADASQYSGSANFNNIKVTDLRSGGLGWTVSAIASNLTDGKTNPNSVINSQNVGLTGVTSTPGTGFVGTVTATNNPAANPAVGPTAAGSQGLGGTAAHTVATADVGRGTVTMQGSLTLNAPSSTEAGLFTGTITFTVG